MKAQILTKDNRKPAIKFVLSLKHKDTHEKMYPTQKNKKLVDLLWEKGIWHYKEDIQS